MTSQKSFQRDVRARMARTGESYTAARAHLISDPADGAASGTGAATIRARVSDAKVTDATGRDYDAWFALLDAWGATSRTHTEIAAWLVEEQGVPDWWAQTVTVAYEQERGLRVPGQKKDGFASSASKTVNVPVERLFEAFADPDLRARWLPVEATERTAKPGRRFTADLPEGTRIAVTFQAKGDAKSSAGVEHTRVATAERAAEWKADWRTWLADLKKVLEA
ncbi:SRPBCC domain-containing protein [Nocardiopsis sp. L17-MgMaSL7]|uniref:SRPBCC domain-containing protein n=1 Tax=Nocardiopsis sp. L17-MgMaSL7 TaxID=1938893 RepID=UPI000D711CC9|nr:SRPBCC domain-containing protein [Nocardiopsis sp. L17-MgMaSL7]PWV54999.1 activator of Hsp90 ATPase-like protein [Nocardiopsis sp. L17-MgMaSL7]